MCRLCAAWRVLCQIVQKLRAIRAAQRLVRPEKAVGRRHIILMNVILRLRFRFRLRHRRGLYRRLLHFHGLRLRRALAAAQKHAQNRAQQRGPYASLHSSARTGIHSRPFLHFSNYPSFLVSCTLCMVETSKTGINYTPISIIIYPTVKCKTAGGGIVQIMAARRGINESPASRRGNCSLSAVYRCSTRSRISCVRPWFQYWVPM